MDNVYDAILVVSFGGPEGMDDVIPFLENVLRGRNVPRERMIEVSHHYEQFGGVSPINAQNRALIAALEADMKAAGIDLPVYFGNRNWHPMLADTMRQMKEDGIKRALCFFTSMFSCYSGCRQYRENLYTAQIDVGDGAPEVDKIRMAYNHPGFIEANVDNLEKAFLQIAEENRPKSHVIFTAHSIPMAMANNSHYVRQLTEASRLVAEKLAERGHSFAEWKLVYQSRSGAPHIPWLEPDICDYLEALGGQGVTDVAVLPIGFISDHMEVMYDLDDEAQEASGNAGMKMVRAASVGTHPAFVRMIRDLIVERMTPGAKRPIIGNYAANHDVCPVGCCLSGRPGESKPSAAQAS